MLASPNKWGVWKGNFLFVQLFVGSLSLHCAYKPNSTSSPINIHNRRIQYKYQESWRKKILWCMNVPYSCNILILHFEPEAIRKPLHIFKVFVNSAISETVDLRLCNIFSKSKCIWGIVQIKYLICFLLPKKIWTPSILTWCFVESFILFVFRRGTYVCSM